MSATGRNHERQPGITRRAFAAGIASLTLAAVTASQEPTPISASSSPTTIAATPTSETPTTIEVRLSPGLGNEWCVYSGQLSDSSLERVSDALITSVTNRTNKRIVLIHWDSAGGRVGPVSLNVSGAADEFNGMTVAGVWEAHVSGGEVDAPQRVALDVTFAPA